MIIYKDLVQGTDEWFQTRIGLVTASNFGTVMSKGKGSSPSKTRRTYMLKLIGERLTGDPADNYSNEHMERGKLMEEEARQLYTMTSGHEVEQVGFITECDYGYSPDGLIGENGLLEIKTKLPHLQLDVLLEQEVPSEHIPQLQGGLLITGREWVDFVSYWPKLPIFIKRVYRDEDKLKEIRDALDRFVFEMNGLMNKIG